MWEEAVAILPFPPGLKPVPEEAGLSLGRSRQEAVHDPPFLFSPAPVLTRLRRRERRKPQACETPGASPEPRTGAYCRELPRHARLHSHLNKAGQEAPIPSLGLLTPTLYPAS